MVAINIFNLLYHTLNGIAIFSYDFEIIIRLLLYIFHKLIIEKICT